jgi:hypothetical protein
MQTTVKKLNKISVNLSDLEDDDAKDDELKAIKDELGKIND